MALQEAQVPFRCQWELSGLRLHLLCALEVRISPITAGLEGDLKVPMNLKEVQLQGAQAVREKHMQLGPACLSWVSALQLLGTFTPTSWVCGPWRWPHRLSGGTSCTNEPALGETEHGCLSSGKLLHLPYIPTLPVCLFIHFSHLQRMMGESVEMGNSVQRMPASVLAGSGPLQWTALLLLVLRRAADPDTSHPRETVACFLG